MVSLLVDGNWCLKRNYYSNKRSTFVEDHSVYNFLKNLSNAIKKATPTRVIIMWDGFNAGKLRYDKYQPYKSNRKKYWNMEKKVIDAGVGFEQDENESYDLLNQKIRIKNYLEELFIRQLEVDFIEADDLIALYTLKTKDIENHKIIIYSNDKDYLQLIESDKVSILNSQDMKFLTESEYEKKYGHTLKNELLFKCFEGDESDVIEGIKGVTRKNLIKHFPRVKEEKYTYDRFEREIEERRNNGHNIKLYDKILESKDLVYRNAELMNLKRPFVNKEAKENVYHVYNDKMNTENRSVKNAIKMFSKDELNRIENVDIESFFSPFYRLMSKEREHS